MKRLLKVLLWFIVSTPGLCADLTARMTTAQGVIDLRLFPERAPVASANFAELARKGFYSGSGFHRIKPRHTLVGGAPAGKTAGGPGYCFAGDVPTAKHDKAGLLSMVSWGVGTLGSQFQITLGPAPDLDELSTVFGEVTVGMDVLEKLAASGASAEIEKVEITGDVVSPAFAKTPELDGPALAKLLDEDLSALTASIGRSLALGKLKKVELESIRSRCASSQASFRADFVGSPSARLLVLAQAGEGKATIRQFQFERTVP